MPVSLILLLVLLVIASALVLRELIVFQLWMRRIRHIRSGYGFQTRDRMVFGHTGAGSTNQPPR
jgi:hypothetical protein